MIPLRISSLRLKSLETIEMKMNSLGCSILTLLEKAGFNLGRFILAEVDYLLFLMGALFVGTGIYSQESDTLIYSTTYDFTWFLPKPIWSWIWAGACVILLGFLIREAIPYYKSNRRKHIWPISIFQELYQELYQED